MFRNEHNSATEWSPLDDACHRGPIPAANCGASHRERTRGNGRSRGRTVGSWVAGGLVIAALAIAARTLAPPAPVAAQAGRTPSANRAPTRGGSAERVATKADTSRSALPRATSPLNAARTATSPTGPAPSESNIAAVVNGQSITRDGLARECMRRFGEEVLESVVNKQLIAVECARQGIEITDQHVAQEIERMAGKFGLSTDRWLQLLRDERQITPEAYQREIIWPMLALRQLAAGQIELSQAELKEAFESEYGPKVKARIIVASSRTEADKLLTMVKADPERFGDIAKDHSVDRNSASARGLVPPIRKHTGSKELEDAAFALEEGEVSGVIEAANQFLILKCEKKIPESFVAAQQLSETEGRLRDQIQEQKLRTAASGLFKRLQEQSKVVNVLNDAKLNREMPGVAALVNGRPIPIAELAAECLQRHGEEVLDGEINRLILQQALTHKKVEVTQDDLDEEVRRAADAYGFVKKDGSPDVDAWIRHVTADGGEHYSVDLYMLDAVWPSVALKKLVGASVEISDEDLRKGFESNYGERVEVLAIVVNNQRRAQQVWEMARNDPSEQFFGDLATQYSIEPVSRANLGKVPPIRRHGGNDLVEEEAFKLGPGELSGVIAVADKYIILKCLGRTQPIVSKIDDVRDELTKELREQKTRGAMAAEFDRLKETAKVQTYLTGIVTRGRLHQTAQTAGAN